MKKERIKIGGKNYRILPISEVREDLERFLDDNKVRRDEQINLNVLRRKDPSLFQQLSLHGYRLSGRINPRDAIWSLGYLTRTHLSSEEIERYIRGVITKEFAGRSYRGELDGFVSIKDLFMNSGALERQAYWACFNRKRKDYSSKRLEKIIDSLYPDLEKQHGKKLTEALRGAKLSEEQVKDKVKQWFYAGGDISRDGLTFIKPDGKLVRTRIENRVVQPSLPGHNNFTRTLLNYLDIEDIKPEDVIADGQEARKNVSLIGEKQFMFLLMILQKYDPELEAIGRDFRRYFNGRLERVFYRNKDRALELKDRGNVIEADGRVKVDNLEVLVEVKTHKKKADDKILDIFRKYDGVNRWIDGSKIDERVVLINAHNNGVDRYKQNLEKSGWKVITGEEFSDFYRRGLEILLENEPDFFETAKIPVTNPEILLEIHELVYRKQHLLLRKGQRRNRRWILDMLKENIACLDSGERVYNRKKFDKTYVVPFSEFNSIYGSKISTIVDDALIIDLETSGPRNSGEIIAVLGLAYKSEDGMVAEKHLKKKPCEEKEALIRTRELARKYRRIVSYNGKRFDEGFLRERLLANLIEFDHDVGHVDMYSDYYRGYARKKGFPSATLKTFERVSLGVKRIRDISGDKVPKIYLDYIFGRDDSMIQDVLLHNQLDLVTLALMYKQLHKT